jgi:hypothetical protein
MRIYNKEEWAKLEAQGKGRYLLWKGVIGRGVPMGLVVALLIELWDPSGEMPGALLEPRFLGRLLLAVAVFAASGCISALANWRVHERRFEDKG